MNRLSFLLLLLLSCLLSTLNSQAQDDKIPIPPGKDTFFQRGTYYFKKENYPEAIRNFSIRIARTPNAVNTLFNRGLCYKLLKQYDSAIQDFSTVLLLQDKNEKAYVQRGECYFIKYNYDLAGTDFFQALNINPDNTQAYSGIMDIARKRYREFSIMELANKTLNEKRSDKDEERLARGLELLSALIKKVPSKPDAYALSGDFHYMVDDYSEAIDYYNRSVQTDPVFAAAYMGRADALRRLRRNEEALQDFNKGVELEPIAYNYYSRGYFHEKTGNRELALADYKQAVKLEPSRKTFTEALNNLLNKK